MISDAVANLFINILKHLYCTILRSFVFLGGLLSYKLVLCIHLLIIIGCTIIILHRIIITTSYILLNVMVVFRSLFTSLYLIHYS